jgi:uncharacterized RDD family membrane protein YckC
MDWHYADNGERFGPVSEEQLLQLARTGVVKPDMLVWQPGMTEWKPFRLAGPGVAVPPSLPDDTPRRFCVSCGRQFPVSDLAIFGQSAVCAECKPAWTQKLRQGMTSAEQANFQYAGFWIRVGAYLIDGFIMSVVQGIVFFGIFGGTFFEYLRRITESAQAGNQPNPALIMAPLFAAIAPFQLLAFVSQLAYSVFFWVKYGATPGKMAVGIKVIAANGGPVSLGQALGRYFGRILSGFILGIGYMMAGWDDEKRALHDRLAGTRVIRVR